VDVSRNWGFVTPEEQERLATVKVAIAGAGGDGGFVAEHLARFGVRRFALADPEFFEKENTNRQNGCDVTTLGLNKAEVIADIIRRIAPDAELDVYPKGIAPENIDEFIEGSAVAVDETEYTQPQLSLMLARAARPRQIPVVSGLNVGYGAILTTFMPGRMTLEQYLGLPPDISLEDAATFDLPLRRWVVRLPSYGDEAGLRLLASKAVSAPSVAPGVAIACGLVVTETFNVLTGRRRPIVAPKTLWFDALDLRLRMVRFRTLSYYGSLARMLARSRMGRNPRVTPPPGVLKTP
jgi:molybdopterin/thiamine biosynthesis adenylyltransferase